MYDVHLLMQGEFIQIDKSLATLQVKAPSVVAFGQHPEFPTEIRVVVEDNTFNMTSLVTAIHFCFAL